MAEARLVSTCELVHELAAAHLVELGEYGVTGTARGALKMAIANFKDVQPDARLAINTSSQATARMKKLFSNTSDLLKRKLDTKMIAFRQTNEVFFTSYMQASNVIEPGKPSKPAEPAAPAK